MARMADELADLYPAGRLGRAAAAAGQSGLGALLLTPGPDLRYVIGYDASQLERLTCLAIPAAGPPFLVVPRLELPAAQASPAGGLGLEIIPWDETDDPYTLVAGRPGAPGGPVPGPARAGLGSAGRAGGPGARPLPRNLPRRRAAPRPG